MSLVEQNSRQLKRPRSLSSDRASNGVVVKKQRREDKSLDHWVPSERFWNSLPKIYLTRRALDELDRRNRTRAVKVQHTSRDTKLAPRRSARRQHPIPELGSSLIRESDAKLKRFARTGGPDLTGIRGFPDPTMNDPTSPPSKHTGSGRTTSSKRSGPYDANYQLMLAQTGVFLTEETDENDNVVLPANFDEIFTRLNVPRESLSPSRFTENDFQRFRRRTNQEILEAETMQHSMAIIEGDGGRISSRVGGKFNNLEPINPELAMAMPDAYDGAPPLSIDHRVLNKLGNYIVPNTDSSRPATPNFFLEGKSRMGRADVAQRQAAHVGAIGARAMASLQSYPNSPKYDNNAYSFTSTYHDGQLKMYTTHATAPKTPGGRPQYHMTQIDAFGMTGNSKTFREGATHYRNARDLAKEQRDSFIQHANQMAQQMPTSEHSCRSRSRGRSRTTTNMASTVRTNHQSHDHAFSSGAGTTTNTASTVRTNRQSHEHALSLGTGIGTGTDTDTDTSTDELALDEPIKRSRLVQGISRRRAPESRTPDLFG